MQLTVTNRPKTCLIEDERSREGRERKTMMGAGSRSSSDEHEIPGKRESQKHEQNSREAAVEPKAGFANGLGITVNAKSDVVQCSDF